MGSFRAGVVLSLCAYVVWGALPLYLKLLAQVVPLEIVAHRILWSALLLSLALGIRGQLGAVLLAAREPATLRRFVGTAALVGVNWLVYVWAVAQGRVVDASLGYFISPLVSVGLGVVALGERLKRRQWWAFGLATLGVLWLTFQAQQFPWIGLTLAFSFGAYGLFRKTAALGSVQGLTLETWLLLPLVLGYFLWITMQGQNTFSSADGRLQLLLIAAGPLTALPLLCYTAGARRIPLSLVGILQYLGPTLQLLLGVLLYREPFPLLKFVGYALIWFGLGLYAAESLRTARTAE